MADHNGYSPDGEDRLADPPVVEPAPVVKPVPVVEPVPVILVSSGDEGTDSDPEEFMIGIATETDESDPEEYDMAEDADGDDEIETDSEMDLETDEEEIVPGPELVYVTDDGYMADLLYPEWVGVHAEADEPPPVPPPMTPLMPPPMTPLMPPPPAEVQWTVPYTWFLAACFDLEVERGRAAELRHTLDTRMGMLMTLLQGGGFHGGFGPPGGFGPQGG